MNRIKELRNKKGLTVKELSEIIGISQSMISNYENENSEPRDKEIWTRLASFFDVSVPYIRGFIGNVEYANMTFEPYYKLHYSFFNSREYKVLTYFCDYEEIVAFLIMQAYSTKNKGVINYDHTDGLNISEELALYTNLSYDVVENTLEAAEKAGLIKMTNEQIVFLDVQKQFNRKRNE